MPEQCAFAYLAFHDLTTCRDIGFGIGPIKWTAIHAYADRYGVDDSDEFERFSALIRAMDSAYRAALAKKEKS